MQPQQPTEALERWMALYMGDIYRFSVGMLSDRHLAEDACQETFLKAYRGVKGLKKNASERAWLLTIALNVCRDLLRKPYAKRVTVLADWNHVAQTERDPLASALYDAIQTLPERQRAVVLLFYYHDLPAEEVARMLHLTRGRVYADLKRAKQTLYGELQDERGVSHVAAV